MVTLEKKLNSRRRNIFVSLFKMEEFGVIAAVIIFCVLVTIINPRFISGVNLYSVGENIAYLMIAASAMTMVMITASFDLSVGAVMAFISCIAGLLMVANVNVVLACIIGLIAGGAVGLFNGILIVKVGIPSFIVTLGTMYMARGAVTVITHGTPIFPLPDSFAVLGTGVIAGIPICVFIMVWVVIVAEFILRRTSYGRSLYAIGGNVETARLSGLQVDKIKISVYVISSIMAGITGLIMTSKLLSAQLSLGEGWEMKIIAVVVIGGTSMMGGKGTILGTLFGCILLAVINNGMILVGINAFWQQIVIGAVIIIAVAIDVIRRRSAGLNT